MKKKRSIEEKRKKKIKLRWFLLTEPQESAQVLMLMGYFQKIDFHQTNCN